MGGLVLLAAGYLWGRRAPAPYDRAARGLGAAASVQARSGVAHDDDEREVERRRAARLAFWDGLGRRVDAEAVDPSWSRETEAVILRVIPEQFGPPVSVKAVCRSTICRATLGHPSWPRIPEDRFVRFTLNRESLGTMEIQLDTRAEGTTTLYFLRQPSAPPGP